jgi:hypothetical protein
LNHVFVTALKLERFENTVGNLRRKHLSSSATKGAAKLLATSETTGSDHDGIHQLVGFVGFVYLSHTPLSTSTDLYVVSR